MTGKRSAVIAALALTATTMLAGCGSDADVENATSSIAATEQGAGEGTETDGEETAEENLVPPQEATDMVAISVDIARQITEYVNKTVPAGTSAQTTAALTEGGQSLVTEARKLSTEDAVVLTVAANQSDLNFPGEYEMAPIDGFLVVDVLFESEYSCTVSIPNVSTTPDTVELEFDAASAASTGAVRCGR